MFLAGIIPNIEAWVSRIPLNLQECVIFEIINEYIRTISHILDLLVSIRRCLAHVYSGRHKNIWASIKHLRESIDWQIKSNCAHLSHRILALLQIVGCSILDTIIKSKRQALPKCRKRSGNLWGEISVGLIIWTP